MLKNSYYIYGDSKNLNLPFHLNAGQYMIEILRSHGDKVALINGATHEELTFRDILWDTMNIAISLARLGVKKGDVVAICSENRQEYWSTLFGILCSGATATAINIMYKKDELEYVLNISKPKMIFCSASYYKDHEKTLRNLSHLKQIILFGSVRLANAMIYDDLAKKLLDHNIDNFMASDVVGQTDTALILYSSGTTGFPKGVMLTHINILTTCVIPRTINTDELPLSTTQWYHIAGLTTLRNLCAGNSMVYLSKFETDLYLKTIEKYQIYQILAAPPILVTLSKTKINYDVSSVRLVFSAAAPLRDDVIKAVKERFPNIKHIWQFYGMTETVSTVFRDTYDNAHLSKVGGVGYITSGFVVKIVDVETRKPLGPNKAGEICVKGSMILMKGYVGKDSTEDFDDEGFFKTGDIGYYDVDKYFFILDRLKELIKYKGYQVPPAEIEGILLQDPSIRDAGVIGVPHEVGGEVPRAYVVLQPGRSLTEQDVISFVEKKLSNPKHLRGGVKFLNEIPRNPIGKILRKVLREIANNDLKCKI